MADQDDAWRLARVLPGVFQAADHFGFFVTDGTKPRGLTVDFRCLAEDAQESA